MNFTGSVFGIGFIAAIVLLLILIFKNLSSENKKLNEEIKEKEAENKKINDQFSKLTKEKKDNEELKQKMSAGNDIDSFNASLELLQKQSDKGKNRNR